MKSKIDKQIERDNKQMEKDINKIFSIMGKILFVPLLPFFILYWIGDFFLGESWDD